MRSKTFTSVTPLSKTLALILFIALPIAAFYFGKNIAKKELITSTNNQTSDLKLEMTKPNCGKFPSVAQTFFEEARKNDQFRFEQSSATWSYDCRYIAISSLEKNQKQKAHLYRTQNNNIEEIKPPVGSAGEAWPVKWHPNGCLEMGTFVTGITGIVKIYHNPGRGFSIDFNSC